MMDERLKDRNELIKKEDEEIKKQNMELRRLQRKLEERDDRIIYLKREIYKYS